MTLTNKQAVFVTEYLRDFNATQAALRSGYSEKTARSIGQENLTKPDIAAAIKQGIAEKTMGADEVLVRLTEQAKGDLSVFFKVIEEWTFYPLPSYEVIDAKEIEDTSGEKPRMRISYWVRHIALDMDKVTDPQYSHLLHKFSDSPKNGLGIEIYNKQTALQTLAKIHGLLKDNVDITSGGKVINVNIIPDGD